MFKKTLFLLLTKLILFGSLYSQDNVSINDLFSSDQYLNKIVEVTGTIDRISEIDTTSDVNAYILRDQFGQQVVVRTTNNHPVVNRSYTIRGTFEEGPPQGNRQFFFIREQSRSLAEEGELHMVQINSEPEGADVELDGNIVGSTPYSIRLSDGNYTFRVQKPFFETRTIGLVVNGNGVERTVEMQRNLVFYLVTGGGVLLFLLAGGFIFSKNKNGNSNSRSPKPVSSPDPVFPEDPKVVENPTVKIVNPVDKTVKIVPGRFEVISGISDLSELRLYADPGRSQSEYTFGRDPGKTHYHFQLKSETVSRKQAKLIVTKNDYSLINYSETNPTIVNGKPLDINDSHLLNPGDVIEMGEIKLKFMK